MPCADWLPYLEGTGLCVSSRHLVPLVVDSARLPELRPAAVLLPIIQRAQGASLLLTRRADHLSQHAGQIAFPGGKVDQGDASLMQTALRETFEEIGIGAEFIKPAGFLQPCKTSSGFCIFPLVAAVQEGFTLSADRAEVAEIFEVPLSFLMNAENHHKKTVFWKGCTREIYEMPFEDSHGKIYNIWGVTAQIIRQLYDINCNIPT